MRKVISVLFVSLDGVAEAPNEWQFAFDEEMGAVLEHDAGGVRTPCSSAG